MREAARRELAKNWPVIGTCIVLWLGTVILRTPAVGIDPERVFAIVITAGALLTLGAMIERVRTKEKEDQS